jgi:hypothetical protein
VSRSGGSRRKSHKLIYGSIFSGKHQVSSSIPQIYSGGFASLDLLAPPARRHANLCQPRCYYDTARTRSCRIAAANDYSRFPPEPSIRPLARTSRSDGGAPMTARPCRQCGTSASSTRLVAPLPCRNPTPLSGRKPRMRLRRAEDRVIMPIGADNAEYRRDCPPNERLSLLGVRGHKAGRPARITPRDLCHVLSPPAPTGCGRWPQKPMHRNSE